MLINFAFFADLTVINIPCNTKWLSIDNSEVQDTFPQDPFWATEDLFTPREVQIALWEPCTFRPVFLEHNEERHNREEIGVSGPSTSSRD